MKQIHQLSIAIIVLIVTVSAANIQWGKNNWKNIIKADGKGYYAYLPAAFIFHDLNFSFFDSIEKKYSNPEIYYDYRVNYNGKIADKYFVGTAVAMLPFFLIAHISSHFIGFSPDGYSKLYLLAINLAAIFYLFLGLVFIKKLLKTYHSPDTHITFLLVVVTFATNIYYYTVCEPAMSHIYSFAFITMFIYFLRIYFVSTQKRYIIILGILLGIITLIRPVNVLIIMIAPFISGDKSVFLNGINYFKKQLLISIYAGLLFVFIVAIQLIIYKIQTGNFWIDAYGNEKFTWSDPHPLNFLFSYRKGLFLYTPVTVLSLLGFYYLFKQNKFQFYTLSVFLLFLLYILSSWWCWSYGGSFSSRVCIEYYAIMVLLIYFAFNVLKSKLSKLIYSSLLIGLLLICQIQTYQYRYYFIHWDRMDKSHYWNVFLRLDLLKNKQNPNVDLLQ